MRGKERPYRGVRVRVVPGAEEGNEGGCERCAKSSGYVWLCFFVKWSLQEYVNVEVEDKIIDSIINFSSTIF